jgi:hypothetical protein
MITSDQYTNQLGVINENDSRRRLDSSSTTVSTNITSQ